MKSVLIGVPGSRRARLWQSALRAHGWPPAEEISYSAALRSDDARQLMTAARIVRLESPDDDLETNAYFLSRGAHYAHKEEFRPISDRDAWSALAERGRIVNPRQWFLGYRVSLRSVFTVIVRAQTRPMTKPPIIEMLYDKTACHRHLFDAGVNVPPALPYTRCYDDVRVRLDDTPRGRLMVKLRHGSAAAGAVAIEKHKDKIRALTTAELVDTPDGPRVYLTRKIRTLHSEAEIARLIDVMAPWGLHAEAWLPKDRWPDGRRYDLRVLTIAGEPCHAVVRLSRSPFTNLNLLNERADAAPLRQRDWWPKVEDVCRRTAKAFPGAFHLGIDVLVTPHGRDVYVLEANAFGDLLPGITYNGLSTYEAELAALEREFSA